MLNEESLQQLLEMGFEEERAKRVLLHYRNSVERAAEHLINSLDDSGISDPNEGLAAEGDNPEREEVK